MRDRISALWTRFMGMVERIVGDDRLEALVSFLETWLPLE